MEVEEGGVAVAGEGVASPEGECQAKLNFD